MPRLLQRKFKGCKGEQPIKKKSKSLGTFSKIFTCLILQNIPTNLRKIPGSELQHMGVIATTLTATERITLADLLPWALNGFWKTQSGNRPSEVTRLHLLDLLKRYEVGELVIGWEGETRSPALSWLLLPAIGVPRHGWVQSSGVASTWWTALSVLRSSPPFTPGSSNAQLIFTPVPLHWLVQTLQNQQPWKSGTPRICHRFYEHRCCIRQLSLSSASQLAVWIQPPLPHDRNTTLTFYCVF